MQIELSPRAEQMVNDLVAQGRFASAQEALEAGVLALFQLDAETEAFFADRDEAWWADLRAKIQEGIDAIEAGRSEPISPELIERIKQEGRERRRASASA
jgi:Arc/MetJ-type ribon-helix-helix transcriptional regulator